MRVRILIICLLLAACTAKDESSDDSVKVAEQEASTYPVAEPDALAFPVDELVYRSEELVFPAPEVTN